MTHETTMAIRSYAKDAYQQDSFMALMDYYGTNCLQEITEEMGLAFLEKLESGEVEI